MDEPRLLILETSGRRGAVGVARGAELRAVRLLDETRRNARDLAPAVAELLAEQGWRAADLASVLVSLGPGSYTGLRVGVMSAKALAYATRCALLGIDTFDAIARQVPADVARADVLADAQQDRVYVRPYERRDGEMRRAGELAIRPLAEWLAGRAEGAAATGPGLHKWREHLPADVAVIDAGAWEPAVGSLLAIGLARHAADERDDPFALEPLYLRPSSAEEQWDGNRRR